MKFLNVILAAMLSACLATGAQAQGTSGWTRVGQTWSPTGRGADLAVTGTTSNVALPTTGAGTAVNVCNTGSVDAYINLGTSVAVVATTAAGYLVSAGQCNTYDLKPFQTQQTYLAAITATGSTTIKTTVGLGAPSPTSVVATISGALSVTVLNQLSIPVPMTQSGLFTITGLLPAPNQGFTHFILPSITGSGVTAILAAGTGTQTIKVYALTLTCTGAATAVTLTDTTPANLSTAYPLLSYGSLNFPYTTQPWFVTAAAKGLSINLSVAATCVGDIWYILA